jgi:hypothetical protein
LLRNLLSHRVVRLLRNLPRPVTPEARSEARNNVARATSSDEQRRLRSVGAAFSAYTCSWVFSSTAPRKSK